MINSLKLKSWKREYQYWNNMQCKTHNVCVTFPFTFFSKLKNMENWKFIKQVKETFIARGMSQKIILISLLYVFTNMIQLCIIKHARTRHREKIWLYTYNVSTDWVKTKAIILVYFPPRRIRGNSFWRGEQT